MSANYIVRHGAMRFLGEYEPAAGALHPRGQHVILRTERGHCLGLGLRHRGKFDCLPLAIEAIEFARNARALGGIVMHEQLDAERGSADAAARIDAWS